VCTTEPRPPPELIAARLLPRRRQCSPVSNTPWSVVVGIFFCCFSRFWPGLNTGCVGAAAPVTGAAADEYNDASVTVARQSSCQ
jgi:hypothetical protein